MYDEVARVLIWGKTYPTLSKRHVETVCTGGVRDDGRPIRLYPVPLRYLDTDRKYSLYDWITVPIEKASDDPRPESFKVRPGEIVIVDNIDSKDGWRARQAAVFKNPDWQFSSITAFMNDRVSSKRSMAVITPGVAEGVDLIERPASERREYEEKMRVIQSQGDMFHPQYKDLEFLPYKIRLRWRCADRQACTCATELHDHLVLDWGLLELARKAGWPKAKQKLEEIADLDRYEFKVFVGNFKQHPQNWGIIGLWYPTVQPVDLQEELPL